LRLEQLEDRTLLSSFFAATASDLIADINAANAAGGTNTITLAKKTTFTLTQVNNTTDGPTGLPVIASGDNLTIVGNGDTIERSTASGTPDFRLFDVASSASLTLNNLTLQNGVAFGSGNGADGGAIYSNGSLALSSVTLTGNAAYVGGGIYIAAGSGASLGQDTFTYNTAYGSTSVANLGVAGGAIYVGGALNSSGDTFENNGFSSSGLGGAVCVAGGSATMTGDLVQNNGAFAAIFITNAGVVFCHDTIRDNYGGGIESYPGGGGFADMDQFTFDHTVANDSFNIEVPYTIINC
jgi:hypothetical protein